MRVILTKNVPKLGEVGDVCEVAPGYGRNFLLPQGMAILATSGALRQVDDLKRTETRRQDRVRSDMSDMAKRLESLDLVFTAKVGQTGRLYGSITSSDIADRASELLGEEVDRRKIILDESLRSLGEHQVPIHLMPGLDAHLRVIVQPDEELVEDLGVPSYDIDGEEPGDAEYEAEAGQGESAEEAVHAGAATGNDELDEIGTEE